MKNSVAIVDYGVGNLFSLSASLAALGVAAVVTADEKELAACRRVILPGVGAFGDAKDKLDATGLGDVVCRLAAGGKPLLGICLGMQLLFEKSHEFGEKAGLGLLQGEICPLEADLRTGGWPYKVPHIGWNRLEFRRPESTMLKNTTESEYFYYVHSFYAKNCESSLVATSEYGVDVPGVVQRGNVFGTQFHPEKSGEAGLRMLRAFVEAPI